jgi:hypothetical protein
MVTTGGQVVYVVRTPVTAEVAVEVGAVEVAVEVGAVVPVPVPGSGKNVKVSPSVVSITGVVTPTGTTTVLVPQIRSPEEEVTVCPSGKVSVNTGTSVEVGD